jgi:hypothetical protein
MGLVNCRQGIWRNANVQVGSLGQTAQNQLPAVNVSAVQQTIHQLVHSRGSFWWLTHQFGCFKTNLKGLVLNPSDGHKSR